MLKWFTWLYLQHFLRYVNNQRWIWFILGSTVTLTVYITNFGSVIFLRATKMKFKSNIDFKTWQKSVYIATVNVTLLKNSLRLSHFFECVWVYFVSSVISPEIYPAQTLSSTTFSNILFPFALNKFLLSIRNNKIYLFPTDFDPKLFLYIIFLYVRYTPYHTLSIPTTKRTEKVF